MSSAFTDERLFDFYWFLCCFRDAITTQVFSPTKNVVKVTWALLNCIEVVQLLIPRYTVCKIRSDRKLRWWEFQACITKYWTHIKIVRQNEFRVMIIKDLSSIESEIWGITPSICAPPLRGPIWEACFITAEYRLIKFCQVYSKKIPYHLQKLIFSFLHFVR